MDATQFNPDIDMISDDELNTARTFFPSIEIAGSALATREDMLASLMLEQVGKTIKEYKYFTRPYPTRKGASYLSNPYNGVEECFTVTNRFWPFVAAIEEYVPLSINDWCRIKRTCHAIVYRNPDVRKQPYPTTFESETGLVKLRVRPDGNCLFKAFTRCLRFRNFRLTKDQLRKQIVDHMYTAEFQMSSDKCNPIETNQMIIDSYNHYGFTIGDKTYLRKGTVTYLNYLDVIKRNGVWGDELCIRAMSHLYSVAIITIDLSSGAPIVRMIDCSDETHLDPLVLYMKNITHFEAIADPTADVYESLMNKVNRFEKYANLDRNPDICVINQVEQVARLVGIADEVIAKWDFEYEEKKEIRIRRRAEQEKEAKSEKAKNRIDKELVDEIAKSIFEDGEKRLIDAAVQIKRVIPDIKDEAENIASKGEATNDGNGSVCSEGEIVKNEKANEVLPTEKYREYMVTGMNKAIAVLDEGKKFEVKTVYNLYKRFEISRHNLFQRYCCADLGIEYIENLSIEQIITMALSDRSDMEQTINVLMDSEIVKKFNRTPDAYKWVGEEDEEILTIIDFTVSLNPNGRHDEKYSKYQPYVDLLIDNGIPAAYTTIAFDIRNGNVLILGGTNVAINLSHKEILDIREYSNLLQTFETKARLSMTTEEQEYYDLEKRKTEEEEAEIDLGFSLSTEEFRSILDGCKSWADFKIHLNDDVDFSFFESLINNYSLDSEPGKYNEIRLKLQTHIDDSIGLITQKEWDRPPVQPTNAIVVKAFEKIKENCQSSFTVMQCPKPSIPFAWPMSPNSIWSVLRYEEYKDLDPKVRRMAIFSKAIQTASDDGTMSSLKSLTNLQGIFIYLKLDNETMKQLSEGKKIVVKCLNDEIKYYEKDRWNELLESGEFKCMTRLKKQETIIFEMKPGRQAFKDFLKEAGVGLKAEHKDVINPVEKKQTLAWWDLNIKYAAEKEFEEISKILPDNEEDIKNLLDEISLLYDNSFNTSMTANCGIRLVFTSNPYVCMMVFSSKSLFDRAATIAYKIIIIEPSQFKDFKIMNRNIIKESFKCMYGNIHVTKAFRLNKERLRILSDVKFRFMSAYRSLTAILTNDNPGVDVEIRKEMTTHIFMMSVNVKLCNSKIMEDAKYQFDNCLADYSKFNEYAEEKMAVDLKNSYQVKLFYTVQEMLKNVNQSKEEAEVFRPSILDKAGTDEVHGFGYKRANLNDFFCQDVKRNQPHTVISEITIMNFLCAKNMHEHYHNFVKLHKTPIEIELEQRVDQPDSWCEDEFRTTHGLTHSYNLSFVMACTELGNRSIAPKRAVLRKKIEFAGRRTDISLRIPTLSSAKSSAISYELERDDLLIADTFPELNQDISTALQDVVAKLGSKTNFRKVKGIVRSRLIKKMMSKKGNIKMTKKAAELAINKQMAGISFNQITRKICRYNKIKNTEAENLCRETGAKKFAKTTCFIHENLRIHNEQEAYYKQLVQKVISKNLTTNAENHDWRAIIVPTCLEKVPYLDSKFERKAISKEDRIKLQADEVILFEMMITERFNHIVKTDMDSAINQIANEIMDTSFNLNSQALQTLMNEEMEKIMVIVNKGQRTKDDREIYILSPKLKILAYMIESTFREVNNNITEEMISIPGDRKSVVFMKQYQSIEAWKYMKISEEKEKIAATKILECDKLYTWVFHNSLDMTKYSNRDVTFKYAIVIATTNFLKKNEKMALLACLFLHMEKKMFIPPEILNKIRANKAGMTKKEIIDNIFMQASENATDLFLTIQQNWGQGVYNSISSFLHACVMKLVELGMKNKFGNERCKVWANVHSDDNLTSVAIRTKEEKDPTFVKQISIIKYALEAGGFKMSEKKSFTDSNIMQMLSEYNFAGYQCSLWVKQVMLSTLALPHTGLHEDMSACISRLQSAAAKGAPAQLIDSVFQDMSMKLVKLYGFDKEADWSVKLGLKKENLPLCMGGLYKGDYTILTLCGPRSHHQINISKLIEKLGGDILEDRPCLTGKMSDEDRILIQTYFFCDQSNTTLPLEYDAYHSSFLNPFQFAKFMKKRILYNDPWDHITKFEQGEIINKFREDYKLYAVVKPQLWKNLKKYYIMLYNDHSFRFSISRQSELQLYFNRVCSKYQKNVRIGQPLVIDGDRENIELFTPEELVKHVSNEINTSAINDSDRVIKDKLLVLFNRYVKPDDRFKVTYHVVENSEAVAAIHQIGLGPYTVPNVSPYSNYINPPQLLFQYVFDRDNFIEEGKKPRYPSVFIEEANRLSDSLGADLNPRQIQIAFNSHCFNETRIIFTPQVARVDYVDCVLALMSTMNSIKGINQRYLLKRALQMHRGRIRNSILLSKEKKMIQFADTINYACNFFSKVGVPKDEIKVVLKGTHYCGFDWDDLATSCTKSKSLARKMAVCEFICEGTTHLANSLYKVVPRWVIEQKHYGVGRFEVKTTGENLQCTWGGVDQYVDSLVIATRADVRGSINEFELKQHFEKVYWDMSAYAPDSRDKSRKTVAEVFKDIMVAPKFAGRSKTSICLRNIGTSIVLTRQRARDDMYQIRFAPAFGRYIAFDQEWLLQKNSQNGSYCLMNRHANRILLAQKITNNANVHELSIEPPAKSYHAYRYTELLKSGLANGIMENDITKLQPIELLSYRRDAHTIISIQSRWKGRAFDYFSGRKSDIPINQLPILPYVPSITTEDEMSLTFGDSDFLTRLADEEDRSVFNIKYSSQMRPRRIGWVHKMDLNALDNLFFKLAYEYSHNAFKDNAERKLIATFILLALSSLKANGFAISRREESALIVMLSGLNADIESEKIDKILETYNSEQIMLSVKKVEGFFYASESYGVGKQIKDVIFEIYKKLEEFMNRGKEINLKDDLFR
jgi:hypothetical protein